MNTEVMFSSKDHTWGTPLDFFNTLHREFHFNTDVCATAQNAKCQHYYTPEIDGLKQDWNGTCFMNPPYGREIGDWIMKAYAESLKGATVVCLLPSRTDTKYQHEIIFRHAKAICFIKGRLKFGTQGNSAPFPSQLVIFGGSVTDSQLDMLSKLGHVVVNW